MSKLFQWKKASDGDSSDDEAATNNAKDLFDDDYEYRQLSNSNNAESFDLYYSNDSSRNELEVERDKNARRKERKKRKLSREALDSDEFGFLTTTTTSSSSQPNLFDKQRINHAQGKSSKGRKKKLDRLSDPNYNLLFSSTAESIAPMTWDLNLAEEAANGINYDQLVQDYGLNVNLLRHDLPLEILRSRMYNMNLKFTEQFSFLLHEFSIREKYLQELNYGLKLLTDKMKNQEDYSMIIKDVILKTSKLEFEISEIFKNKQEKNAANDVKIEEILKRIDNLEKMSKDSDLKSLQEYIEKEVISKNKELENCRKAYDETILDLKSQLSLLQIGENAVNNIKKSTKVIAPPVYYSNNQNCVSELSFDTKTSCMLPFTSQTNRKIDVNRCNEALVGFLQQRCVNLEKALLLAGTSRYASSIANADSGVENLSGQTTLDVSKYEALGRSRDPNTLNSAISTLKSLLINKEKDLITLESEIRKFAEQMSMLIQDNIEKDMAIEKIRLLLKEENVLFSDDLDPLDKPHKLSEIDIAIRQIIHNAKEEKSLKEVRAKLAAANITLLRQEQFISDKDKIILSLNQKIEDYEKERATLKAMMDNEIEKNRIAVDESKKLSENKLTHKISKQAQFDESLQTEGIVSLNAALSMPNKEEIAGNKIDLKSEFSESTDGKSLRSIILQDTLEQDDVLSLNSLISEASKNSNEENPKAQNGQAKSDQPVILDMAPADLFSKVSTTEISTSQLSTN